MFGEGWCFLIDGISYLGLERVFTANMTGNAVLLGLAIGQAQELQVVRSVVALMGFVYWVVFTNAGAGR